MMNNMLIESLVMQDKIKYIKMTKDKFSKIFFFNYPKYLIFLLTFLISSTFVKAEIIPTFSINSSTFKELINNIDSSTLVLINIDDTIIRPKSKMFLYQNSSYRAFIENLIVASKNDAFFNDPIKTWFTQRKIILVEPEWPEFIENLKKTGALVLGLSEMNIKIYDLIKEPENWRLSELNNLNIHFHDKINDQNIIKIDKLKNQLAVFHKGIIFTGPFSKGKTLIDFMRVTNITPRKIVIIDNRIDHLKQVEYFLRKLDIDYYSIHYLAMTQIQDKQDDQVIKFQQKTLLKESKWLEDEEADQILKSINRAPSNN